MKKLLLHSFVCATCFAFVTSCSKDVKAPAPKNTSVAKTNTKPGTQTSNNNNQVGHNCGNHTYSNGSSGYSGNN